MLLNQLALSNQPVLEAAREYSNPAVWLAEKCHGPHRPGIHFGDNAVYGGLSATSVGVGKHCEACRTLAERPRGREANRAQG